MIPITKKFSSPQVYFSPVSFKAARTNYTKGYLADIVAMFEYAEEDGHVIGCMGGRKAGFARNWSLKAYSDSAQDEQIKEFVESVFDNIDLYTLSKYIIESRFRKFSVIELEWIIENKQQIIKSFNKLPQRYFFIDPDTNEVQINNNNKPQPIEQGAALIAVSDEVPLMLPILRDYILKEFGLETWSSFIENFGEDIILGKYPAGAGPDMIQQLEDGVNKIAASARGVIPEGCNIDLKESGRDTADHQAYVDRCDKSIAIAILGHADAALGTKGIQVGNNDSAYKVKLDIAIDDIRFIEKTIKQLIRMLVDRNFSTKFYPTFEIDKSGPIDVKERLLTIETAYNMGFEISPEEFVALGLRKSDNQEPLKKVIPNLLD